MPPDAMFISSSGLDFVNKHLRIGGSDTKMVPEGSHDLF